VANGRDDLATVNRYRAKRAVARLWPALLFGLAHSQAALYTSNQNTYFLHGLALAGRGYLAEDVLVQSPDPFPLFTGLVRFTVEYLHETVFHLYYLIVLGLFFWALFGIAAQTTPLLRTDNRHRLFAALLIAIHSYLLHKLLWPFQSGVAGQYVLGPVLQPSVFGVLLIVGVLLFVQRRPYSAAIALALGAAVHSSYLPAGGILALSFVVASWTDSRLRRRAILGMLLYCLLCVPSLIYAWQHFRPTSPEVFAEAVRILVHERMPHHAIPARWFSIQDVLRFGLIAGAYWVTRKTVVGRILIVSSMIGIALTIIQVITALIGQLSASDRMALLFPWRISVVLVPIASTVLLACGVSYTIARYRVTKRQIKHHAMAIARVAVASLAAIGIGRAIYLRQITVAPDGDSVAAYAARTRQAQDCYLLPPRAENLRLLIGAPVYVDYKTHPYRDADVIAWFHRLQTAERFTRTGDCAILDSLARAGAITHAIVPVALEVHPEECPLLILHADERYNLARVRN